ncbi:MAG: c-type cytochrome [Candidatus Omnitrophica bacterium]|nr:c-type cytochrome [Candidatus Omnitrophota bacterium]
MRLSVWWILTPLILLILIGCGGDSTSDRPKLDQVRIDVDARRPAMNLSDYNLFSDLATLTPNDGVLPYQVNNSQYLDGALLRYFVYIPPAAKIEFDSNGLPNLPVGSALIQNLSFPTDLRKPEEEARQLETRLLIHQSKGWVAVPYLWNEDHSDAERSVVGEKTKIVWKDREGESQSFTYLTPDMNQCKRCHKQNDEVSPIGFTTRNLNMDIESSRERQNQLEHWMALGLFTDSEGETVNERTVSWRDPSFGTIEERARAWLDINCSNCHNPEGEAIVSGLDLSLDQDHPVRFGIYKPPVAAGRGSGGFRFSIDPGKPQSSFLLHRIRSTEPGVMMPPLGRSTVDEEGSQLIEEWIAQIRADSELEERALNPMAAYQGALSGGDPGNGRVIFYEKFKCVACHTAEKRGEGTVGPNLSDVGARTDRNYLLESLIEPSARVVEGFESVMVTTADEEVLTGTILSEDANQITLSNSAGGAESLNKSEILDRRDSSLSIMPSVANLLSVQEVADLLEYLSQQKTRIE